MGSVVLPPETETVLAMTQIMARMTGSGPDKTIIPTGMARVNKLLEGGLRRTNLTVVAGRTSQGKTAFACTMLYHVAVKLGLPCVMYSYEMSPIEILDRMISMEAGIYLNKVRERGVLNVLNDQLKHRLKEGWGVLNGVAKAGALEIVTGGGMTIDNITADVAKRKKKNEIAIVCIDYLQLVKSPPHMLKDSRASQVGYTTAQAKQLAMMNNINVLALSQLNRGVDVRTGEPQLSDLRESGSIEQDANQVIFVFDAEGKYQVGVPFGHRMKVLDLQKNRNGAVSRIDVFYYELMTQFLDSPHE